MKRNICVKRNKTLRWLCRKGQTFNSNSNRKKNNNKNSINKKNIKISTRLNTVLRKFFGKKTQPKILPFKCLFCIGILSKYLSLINRTLKTQFAPTRIFFSFFFRFFLCSYFSKKYSRSTAHGDPTWFVTIEFQLLFSILLFLVLI